MSPLAIGSHIKQLPAAITTVDVPRRMFTFIASVEDVDRDGEVILVDGIDLTDFKKNPVFLADHDHTAVIGGVPNLWTEHRRVGKCLMGSAEIMPPGGSAKADEVWIAIQHQFRQGISVGFRVLVDGPPILKGQTGRTFHRISLLEISSVAIPSCAQCLITSIKSHTKGVAMNTCSCQMGQAKELIDITPEQAALIPGMARAAVIEALAEQSRPDFTEVDAQLRELAPGIVDNLVRETITEQVALAVRRLRGRVD